MNVQVVSYCSLVNKHLYSVFIFKTFVMAFYKLINNFLKFFNNNFSDFRFKFYYSQCKNLPWQATMTGSYGNTAKPKNFLSPCVQMNK